MRVLSTTSVKRSARTVMPASYGVRQSRGRARRRTQQVTDPSARRLGRRTRITPTDRRWTNATKRRQIRLSRVNATCPTGDGVVGRVAEGGFPGCAGWTRAPTYPWLARRRPQLAAKHRSVAALKRPAQRTLLGRKPSPQSTASHSELGVLDSRPWSRRRSPGGTRLPSSCTARRQT